MIAKVSVKGQMVIPEAIREQARIRAGDQLEVGYCSGLIVIGKRKGLSPARVRALLLPGRARPALNPRGGANVSGALQRVGGRGKRGRAGSTPKEATGPSFGR